MAKSMGRKKVMGKERKSKELKICGKRGRLIARLSNPANLSQNSCYALEGQYAHTIQL
jgi:hypothetical protein